MADGGRRIEVGREYGVALISFSSPILAVEVLDEFGAVLEELAAESSPNPVVLRSNHPSVFLAGAHLAEIAALEVVSSVPYCRHGRRVIEQLEGYPAPTIAAIEGSCSGGGFDLVLACDVLIAGPRARFGHPGIQRGLITGWSGTTRLPAVLGRTTARTALLESRDFDVASLSTLGAVRSVAGDSLVIAIETARRQAALDPSRRQLWRALRGSGFIDRFHASVVHKL